MSANIRSFFRSNRTRNKTKNSQTRQNLEEIRLQRSTINPLTIDNPLLVHHTNGRLTNINSSCLGGNEKKKKNTKNQADTPETPQETVSHSKVIADPMDISDHKIQHVVQQHASKVEIDDDLKNLFGKKELTKAMANQLNARALTGPMNSNNDDPPRLCTKKHCTFANEPMTIKPVTCIPGIGPVHGNLCEKHGIVMAHQLLSRYMMSANDDEFEQSLISQLGFTPKSASMTRDGLKEMRRHLI